MAWCQSTFANSGRGATRVHDGLHGRSALERRNGTLGNSEAREIEPERQARRILLERPGALPAAVLAERRRPAASWPSRGRARPPAPCVWRVGVDVRLCAFCLRCRDASSPVATGTESVVARMRLGGERRHRERQRRACRGCSRNQSTSVSSHISSLRQPMNRRPSRGTERVLRREGSAGGCCPSARIESKTLRATGSSDPAHVGPPPPLR